MLCWNVYVGDFNSGKMMLMNIFDSWSFYDACVKAKKKFKEDKEAFAEEVRSWLSYLFRGKCEWEVIVDHWPDGEWSELRQRMTVGEMHQMFMDAGRKCDSWYINDKNQYKKIVLKVYPDDNRFLPIKIDVYDQVVNNWDIFIDYLWDHRKELKARKVK